MILACVHYAALSQFNITIQPTTGPTYEGDLKNYKVIITLTGSLPNKYQFVASVSNGTITSQYLIPTFPPQQPAQLFVEVRWNCLVTLGTVTVTETYSGQSATNNVTILSFLNDPTYCITATPSKQNLFYGQTPQILDVQYCSGYCQSTNDVTYLYQWQVGDVPVGVFPQEPPGGVFTDIPGATGKTYLPPTYNVQCIKAYRRKTTYNVGGSVTKMSSTAVISTFDYLTAGSISGGTVFNNGVPVINQTPATGGLCDGFFYTYTWELSVDNINWSIIGTGSSPTYPAGVQIPGNCYLRRRVDCGGQFAYTTVLTINPPILLGGTITGGGTYSFNAMPVVTQTPASGSACSSPDYIYTWERSVNNGAWVSFGPNGIYYPFNGVIIGSCKVRRKVHCVYEDAYSNELSFIMTPYTFPNAENLNYVRVNDIVIPSVHSWEQADALATGDKLQTTNYLDGFGRTIQTVVKQGSRKQSAPNTDPDNLSYYQDLVSHIQYDGLGRADKGFLPYATETNLGFYKTNAAAEQQSFTNQKYGEPAGSIYTFSQTTYDGSPLNRVTNQKLPGYYWNSNPNYKGISSDYDFNTLAENIRIWDIGYNSGDYPTSPGAYGDNKLIKNITKDEKDKLVVEYKDLSGNVILKKVQEGNNVAINSYQGWLCTYYVYDDFGRLRYTITPKAVATMLQGSNWNVSPVKDGLCFYQEYDKRGRVIVKHSPDGGEVWLVYDKRDRLVFSQDENQRHRYPAKPNQWSFSLYDDNDRSLATGLIDDNTSSRLNMQNYVDLLPLQNQQVSVYTGSPENIIAYNPVVGSFIGSSYPTFITNSLNYYDEYKSSSNSFITLTANDFAITSNQYAELPTKSLRTKGMVTTSKIRVLDQNYDDGVITNDAFLLSTTYIDEKGRVVQTHAQNIKGGTDVASVQYDFAGKVLCTRGKHNLPGNPFNDLLVITKNEYDLLGRNKRLLKLYTKNNSDVANSGTVYKKLSEVALDEFGRARSKQIGNDLVNPANPLETQDYTYNIQGSLTGINKDYALSTDNTSQWTRYLGMYFGYENGDNKFAAPQWNGNITGVIWRSQGDNTPRKYNYEYDNINRFKTATFLQKDRPSEPDNTWGTGKVDLSVFVNYNDANGNIYSMKQTGIIPGTNGGVLIDDMVYQYQSNSNKLINVADQAFTGSPIQNGKQGDFKNFGSTSGTHYEYDFNGNLKNDFNKNIRDNSVDGIISNFLDLPQQIIVKDKSKTEYTYDAAGNKLAKKVTQLTTSPPPPKTTYYIGGFVYETAATVGQPDELQYILNEEGKLRIMEPIAAWSGPSGQVNYLEIQGNIEIANTGTPNKWGVWDYNIKDNLSNVRMVLTEERHKQEMHCSMEDANSNVKSEEEATFSNTPTNNEVANTRTSNASLPWSIVSSGNQKASKLFNIGNNQIGPNAILKVMAGDYITGYVNYFYQTSGPSTNSSVLNNIVTSLILALGGSPNATSIVKDNVSQTYLSSINGPLYSFLQNHQPTGGNANTPRAYVNYIFFDEQFRYVGDGASGAVMVDAITSGNREGILPIDTRATKNGYVYIYLSNESQNIPVYFDNLHIKQERSPILEDNAYYPYGLKIQGISAKAALKPKTKQGYQGDYSEKDDETGYNEFSLRSYDPQIGRWIQVDPNIVQPGMYNGMNNNPISLIDPTGGDPDWYENLETGDKEWFDGSAEIAGFKHLGVDFTTETNIPGVWAYYGFSKDQEWQTKYMDGVTVHSPSAALLRELSQNISSLMDRIDSKNSHFDDQGNLRKYGYNSDDHFGWKAATFGANVFSDIYNSAKYVVTTPPDQQVVDAGVGVWNAGKYWVTTNRFQKIIDISNAVNDPHTYEKAVSFGVMIYATKGSVGSTEVSTEMGFSLTRHGELTNGVYTVSKEAMKEHVFGGVSGKSIFYPTLNANEAVLKAAQYADQNGLWIGNKAKVTVTNTNIGTLGNGAPTNVINVYKNSNGFIHGTPGGN